MRFQFRYCCDESTVLWYGDDYHDVNLRWQLSRMQLRILATLRRRRVKRDDLRRGVVGENLSPSQRASLSRLLRRMKEQNLVVVKDGWLALTAAGRQIHDDLKANKC